MKRTALVWLAGGLLAIAFWWPVAAGKCRIGGDIYDYYLPLKILYADGLSQGRLPLWNPQVGYGAPLLADSQVGLLYPINLVLFRFLSVQLAFEVSFVLHFMLGFGFMYHYGRSLGLSLGPCVVGALAFVYGWFPVRACLEWAYVTGVWMPLALVGVEHRLRGRGWLCLWTTVLALTMQLLAGHFQAAWLTLLAVAGYTVVRRLVEARPWRRTAAEASTAAGACLLAVALAAMQLLPTWELRSVGQRRGAEWRQTIVSESVPAWYLGQAIWPWHYYWGGPKAERVESPTAGAKPELRVGLGAPIGPRNTNMVEANLYPGLLILWLVGAGLTTWRSRPEVRAWAVLLVLSLLLMLGVGMNWLVHLPGFSFFRYPGRYNLISAFALAVLAMAGLARAPSLSRRQAIWLTVLFGAPQVLVAAASLLPLASAGWSERLTAFLSAHCWPVEGLSPTLTPWLLTGVGVCLVAAAVTVLAAGLRRSRWVTGLVVVVCLFEYYMVGRQVTYISFVDSVLADRHASAIGQRVGKTDRLVAPGENLFTLLGVSCLPPYMGLGPAAYFDDELVQRGFIANPNPSERAWRMLRLGGVSHVVNIGPRSEKARLELVWRERPEVGLRDRFIYRAWGRSPGDEALCLYKVVDNPGRAYLVGADGAEPDPTLGHVTVSRYETDRVVLDVEADAACRCVLADLHYPGWTASVNGRAVEIGAFESVFRSVAVGRGSSRVEFRFQPRSLRVGLLITAAALMAAVGLVAVGRRKASAACSRSA